MITAVVLAAGAGRRLGTVAKALLVDEGTSYLERIAATLAAVGVVAPRVVVGPPHADAVRAQAEPLGFTVLGNPDPDRGMASSVEIGFAHARAAEAEVALLWPVDAPFATVETVAALVAASRPDVIVIPTVGGRGGHPVAVGRSFFAALASCLDRKEGARSVFRHNREHQVRLEVPDPRVLVDIDEPRDLPAGVPR